MQKITRICLLMVFMLFAARVKSFAQDIQQAQFFAMPVAMNPAFAGNMEFDCKELRSNLRGSLLSRRQWSAFSSDAFALEFFRKKSKLGFALLFQNQRLGTGRFSNTSAGLAVSHRLSLGNNWHMASGVQFGLIHRNFAVRDFRFTDQFTDKGFTGLLTADNLSANNPAGTFADFSAGSLFFTRLFWAGLSVQHANQPQISDFSEDRLPMKFSIHAGYKFEFRSDPNFGLFKRDVSLHPVWQLRFQKSFMQMDAGFYYNHEPFFAGVLYRGLGFIRKDADFLPSQDAVVMLLGIKRDGFKLGYSMEVNLKRKTFGGLPTQEIALSYQYARKGCLRRRFGKWISAPVF
jgi:type IX secretion system PorP/SprF family membrane protein